MTIDAALIRLWALAILTFFVYMASAPLIPEDFQGIPSGIANAVYVLVGLRTFNLIPLARKPEIERPSAVRARQEAVRRRRGLQND